MKNPWINLQGAYVLPEDQAILQRDKRFFDDKFKLQLQLPPVPFLNNPKIADVVILAKNPGYSPSNDYDLERFPDLIGQNISALTFSSDCPFFYLDSRFKGSDGYVWWDKSLDDVFRVCGEQCGITRQVIERISCVQWYPYHSKRFKQPLEPLPSQEFSFDLVAQASRQNKLFILLWGSGNERLWRTSVPNLPSDCITLNSQQSPRLSRGNMKPQDFNRLILTLCRSQSKAQPIPDEELERRLQAYRQNPLPVTPWQEVSQRIRGQK